MTLAIDRSLALAFLVAGAFFMENLDGTAIATALPQMGASFGVAPVDLNIGISAYLLTLAMFIPASGWVADRFGARGVFGLAVAVFTLASIACGLSRSLTGFTAARIVQGMGGAMMVPVGRLVVLRNTPKQGLMRAIATITWPALAAPVLGPPVGGFITAHASWRWIFLLNVPLGLAALALAFVLIPNARREGDRPFDLVGFLLTGLACLGLMYGIDLIGQQRISWPLTLLVLGCSLTAGLLAVLHARRHPQPLLDLSALKVPSFAVTAYGGTLARTVISAMPFLLPLMFQLAFGLDPVSAGLYVLTLFAGNLVMKPMTSAVLRRFGFRTTLIGNGLILAATMFGCALLTPDTPTALIVAVLFTSGLTRSMHFTAVNTLAFVDIPESRMSGANTLFSVLQQMAFGLGIAVGAVALRSAAALSPGLSPDPTLADFHLAFAALGVLMLVALLDTLKLAQDAGAVATGHRPAAAAGAASEEAG